MPVLRIVRFRKEHLDRVMQIERASFGKLAYPRSLFRDLHAGCGRFFFVARYGRGVAGYAVGCIEQGTAEIVSIAVDPTFRGAGVGAALLARLLDTLRESGFAQVELMVRAGNLPAVRLYRSFGFRRVRPVPGYYEDGADGLLMRRAP